MKKNSQYCVRPEKMLYIENKKIYIGDFDFYISRLIHTTAVSY